VVAVEAFIVVLLALLVVMERLLLLIKTLPKEVLAEL
jgi:hypothetical protein